MNQAVESFKQGDYAKALEGFTAALKLGEVSERHAGLCLLSYASGAMLACVGWKK